MAPKSTPKEQRTSVKLPTELVAYLAWRSSMEGITRDALIERLVRQDHAASTKKNPGTPAIG